MLNEDVMERVLSRDNLITAYRRVKSNGGAAGVDGMSMEVFREHANVHWPLIADKLKAGNYQPGAVRSVSIPKPQGGNADSHSLRHAFYPAKGRTGEKLFSTA